MSDSVQLWDVDLSVNVKLEARNFETKREAEQYIKDCADWTIHLRDNRNLTAVDCSITSSAQYVVDRQEYMYVVEYRYGGEKAFHHTMAIDAKSAVRQTKATLSGCVIPIGAYKQEEHT